MQEVTSSFAVNDMVLDGGDSNELPSPKTTKGTFPEQLKMFREQLQALLDEVESLREEVTLLRERSGHNLDEINKINRQLRTESDEAFRQEMRNLKKVAYRHIENHNIRGD